jgi:hypothetical protein
MHRCFFMHFTLIFQNHLIALIKWAGLFSRWFFYTVKIDCHYNNE